MAGRGAPLSLSAPLSAPPTPCGAGLLFWEARRATGAPSAARLLKWGAPPDAAPQVVSPPALEAFLKADQQRLQQEEQRLLGGGGGGGDPRQGAR